MHIVVAETIADAGLDYLGEHATVEVAVGLSPDELLPRLAVADALVVRSATRVGAGLLAAAPNLKVIGRAGIGMDNIDLTATAAAGVMVVNAPEAAAISAAEHTLALRLSQARRIPEADRALRAGSWERERFRGVELYGKTLGVVGLGRIGTLVAQRGAAFGMRVISYDPYVGADRARRIGVVPMERLADLMAEADFVTVHLPLTRETEGLIGVEALAQAKPGVRIVNTARGGVVDEEALAAAIRAGRVAGAALDVFATEPMTESPLFELAEVVVTPHLGASTVEAQDKAGMAVAEAVIEALRGALVPSAVNIDVGPEVPAGLLQFLPLAEDLGCLFVALSQRLPQRLTVRVEGDLADLPVRPVALAALTGMLAAVSDAPVSFANAPALAKARGVTVIEESAPDSPVYPSGIRLTGDCGDGPVSVAGTVSDRRGPVLIEAFEHMIELPLSRYVAVVLNDDIPGVIGSVGTYLGDLGVNIADMVVGRPTAGEDSSMMGLSLDRSLTQSEVEGMLAMDTCRSAFFVELGGRRR
ncbi:MAG: phosphoglycerate dehydrogenase [Acidimicrobiia bacterium]|nr:phosphoglycerate dehydrogenase [Acidimicrobiia bacterium]